MEKEQKPQVVRGNIILSGFMGSGKSAVGRRLAEVLQMRFVDMDRYIEETSGTTISAIFALQGEAAFRQMEAETVKELAKEQNCVIAAGGGTLLQPANAEAFHAGGGKIYYLDVPLRALQERLKRDKRRPLLQVEDRSAVIEKLLNERRPGYIALSDEVVDAGAPTVVVVRRICALLGVEIPKNTAGADGIPSHSKKHWHGKRNSSSGKN